MTPERTASGKALDVTLVLKLQITEPFSKLEGNSCCYFLPPPSLNSHQPTVINFLSVVLFPFASNGKVFFLLENFTPAIDICQTLVARPTL